MAYELISTPSNQNAVMTAVRDFSVTNGWTLDNFTAAVDGVSRGVMSLHRDDCYVSFRWGGTEPETSQSIAMYQALGYSAGNAASPWLQLDDSGNGTTSSTSLASQRRVSGIGSGPYLNLHLFAFDTDQISTNSAPTVYCVLEFQNGVYRHFGFGTIDKVTDFTGGEWVGGHYWDLGGSNEANPINAEHSVLLDGYANDRNSGTTNDADPRNIATIHLEGLPGQDPTTKWGQVWDGISTSGSNTLDRAGNPRSNVPGGIRLNFYTHQFGNIIPDSLAGFLPLYPCPVFYRRDSGSTDARIYLLGHMANIRMVQLRNFNPGDEISIGSITWKLFPVVRQAETTGDNESSDNMGIAYVKEVS